MLEFLEASHFPRLGLIDFLLIILLISGYGKMCLAFEYFSLNFICSRTWGLFCKYPCSNCPCLRTCLLGLLLVLV